MERLVAAGHADAGFAIALTLDPSYVRGSSRDTIDAAFRLHDGREAAGKLAWGPGAGEGTMRGREKAIDLRYAYTVRWARFGDLGPTWCLALAVPANL